MISFFRANYIKTGYTAPDTTPFVNHLILLYAETVCKNEIKGMKEKEAIVCPPILDQK
jgi:hypothetical protein